MKPSFFTYVFAACGFVTQFSGLNASPLSQSPTNRLALSNFEVRGPNDSFIKDGHEALTIRSQSEEGLLLRSDVVDPVLFGRTQTTGDDSGGQTANPPSGPSKSGSRSDGRLASKPSTSGQELPHGTIVRNEDPRPFTLPAFHGALFAEFHKSEPTKVPGDTEKVRDNNPADNSNASGSDP
ncbi:hypothetical protein H0H93_009718 [Arthromyces matolae]|nr:hypothetical protein H0H93_009718 [Arthromyces matolae]